MPNKIKILGSRLQKNTFPAQSPTATSWVCRASLQSMLQKHTHSRCTWSPRKGRQEGRLLAAPKRSSTHPKSIQARWSSSAQWRRTCNPPPHLNPTGGLLSLLHVLRTVHSYAATSWASQGADSRCLAMPHSIFCTVCIWMYVFFWHARCLSCTNK